MATSISRQNEQDTSTEQIGLEEVELGENSATMEKRVSTKYSLVCYFRHYIVTLNQLIVA